jgi:putative tributyrin esterase
MGCGEIRVRSELLGKETSYHVILPVTGKPPFPTLYLLHGLGGDSSYWIRRSRIEWHVRKLPLVVIMPDGYRGFFVDHVEGPAFGSHVVKELIPHVEQTYNVRHDREGRGIGGCSMGGYGALILSLTHPTMFAAAHSHGASLNLDAVFDVGSSEALTGHPKEFLQEMRRVFGPQVRGSAGDLVRAAERAKEAGTTPQIRMDCGTSDPFLSGNRKFSSELNRLGIAHEYAEYDGGHDWDYYEERTPDAIRFQAAALKAAQL